MWLNATNKSRYIINIFCFCNLLKHTTNGFSMIRGGGLVVSGPTSIGRPFDLEPEPPDRAIRWAANTVLLGN